MVEILGKLNMEAISAKSCKNCKHRENGECLKGIYTPPNVYRYCYHWEEIKSKEK